MSNFQDTPAYYFNIDEFKTRVKMVSDSLKEIPLTYSIKANPFLLYDLPKEIAHVEVCSPGELDICKAYNIPGERIIYSGVNKEFYDIEIAISYGVDIVTCESRLHAELVEAVCEKLGVSEQKVLLRLTSGNQFGMSMEEICSIFEGFSTGKFHSLNILGIHFYSGTQKKTKQITKDIEKINSLLEVLKQKYEYVPSLVEYGPGLTVHYFDAEFENIEKHQLEELVSELEGFENDVPLGIELGRFLAASCGTYATKVMDIKCNDGVNYVICDGGIHQIRYYGQTLAMQVPPIEVVHKDEVCSENGCLKEQSAMKYCLCGSLCTVADVLVREVELPKLSIGDILLLGHCGAYSLYEGNSLFLSRALPKVYVCSEKKETVELRGNFETSTLCHP